MMRFLILLVLFSFLSVAVRADDMPMHRMGTMDDRVEFTLAAEDWVTTKTARADINVEAAVSGATAGNTRAEMMKALGELAKADWRLVSFNRNQDQTGLERWSATFEARLPENELSGLDENAKKLSKAGMQLSVATIDFSPTLEEMEAARGAVRAQIYKMANDQLAALNSALPGHNYRIALIDFTGMEGMPMLKSQLALPGVMHTMAMAASESAPSLERSEKVTLTARVVLAATPPASSSH